MYNSYTISSFIDDIYKAIFDEPRFPWLTSKYDKKIERLFFLLEINLGNRLSRREFNILQNELRDKVRKDTLKIEIDDKIKPILDKTELSTYLQKNNNIACQINPTSNCKKYTELVYNKISNLTYFKFNREITEFDKHIEEVPYLNKYLSNYNLQENTYKNKYYITDSLNHQSDTYKNKYYKYKNKYLNLKKKFEKNEFNLI